MIMSNSRSAVLFWQVAILVVVLVVWQWGFEWSKALLPKAYVPKILDPYFVAKPSLIWQSFLRLGCFADPPASPPASTATTTICGSPRSSR